jgi:uncharacterized RmlC-like cupin family protein
MPDEFVVLNDSDLHELAGPATPGVSRRIAFEGDEYWFGCGEIAPHLMSGWHHHDRNVTLGYVLEGAFRLEYGPGGREHADAKAGQYFLMPPWLIHREGTATDEPCRVLFTRIGGGPPVVPLDGPEPG